MGNRGSLTFAREESAASGARHAKVYPAASSHGQVYLPLRASFRRCMRDGFARGGEDVRRSRASAVVYQGAVDGGVVYFCILLPKIWDCPQPGIGCRRYGGMQVE